VTSQGSQSPSSLHWHWQIAIRWSVISIYLSLVIVFAWNPTPFAQVLAAIGIGSALTHSVLSYGWKATFAFLVICLGITFAVENIGVATGIPFGEYHFGVGAQLPHIGAIPIIVGPLWFGMGYFSFSVARTVLGDFDRNPKGKLQLIALPLVAAFVMTQWDLVMDPPESTIAKAWIWHNGGSDFGVPLSNYFGWFLTSWLFYQAFVLCLRYRQKPHDEARKCRPELQLAAILFYLCSGLTHVTPWLRDQHGDTSDAAGHIWRLHDVRANAVLAMALTMLFTSAIALIRLEADRVCLTDDHTIRRTGAFPTSTLPA